MKQKLNLAVMGLALVCFSPIAKAVNNAPADADTVTLRMSCTEGATQIPNCFETMAAVDIWLRTVRMTGLTKPTLVNISPGNFDGWDCSSSYVTLKGAGRDRTILKGAISTNGGIDIHSGCTQINVQDLKIEGGGQGLGYGVYFDGSNNALSAITSWTNVEITAATYPWVEWSSSTAGACPAVRGKHSWFSSRIIARGTVSAARPYIAKCSESWFWGSELSAEIPFQQNATSAVIKAESGAEVHLYGSNVRLTIASGVNSDMISNRLIEAGGGSEIHIHGTGLDVIHDGTGTADMLYADSTSHFHATASGFNIHVGGTGKVKRLAGTGRIEAPYTWGERTSAPLSTNPDGTPSSNGVGTLVSRNGADRYIETDCQPSGNCSSGGGFPHDMVYLAACTGLAANQGPWFDMTTKACRQ